MRIGDLSAKTGASVRSLRYYEQQGLLVSTRSSSGQRHYDDSAVERVRFLRLLFTAGLSSGTIAELLPCVEVPSTQTMDEAWTRLHQERERIDARIGEMLRTRDALDELIAANRRYRTAMPTG